MIAITGGIASGKSAVAGRLQSLGAVVLDADLLARQAVCRGSAGWARVREVFPQVIKADLSVDRALLAEIIFEDQKARQKLQDIVHPLVLAELLRQAGQSEAQGELVFAEVPLLFEAGWEHLMEEVWVVYVDFQTQLERLLKRSELVPELALKMIASQMPLEEKKSRATRLLDNNGTLSELYRQVDSLFEKVRLR